jgi:very-short-patch-repair endonuclease
VWLEQRGYRVVPVRAAEVETNTTMLLDTIAAAIQAS